MSNKANERGVALLTVITALVALMIIAVPFAITMRMGYERSVASNARSKAKHQVDSVLRFLEAYAVRTTERVELENRANQRKDLDNADPEMDTAREYTPTLQDMATALGVTQEEITDAYGTVLGYEVEDENGKFNLNSASFFALGNLLGLSVLVKDLEPNETTIQLEDATLFPDRGYVKIGRELIKYGGKDGSQLVDCERALATGEPHHGKAEKYNKGLWVVNYAAWAISYYKVARHPGELTEFQTLDVSDISRLTELDPETPVLTQADWERIQPYVTLWSKGELGGGWSNVQELVQGTRLPSKRQKNDYFNFANSYYFNPGTIIRIQEKADTNIEREPQRDTATKALRPRRRDYAMVYQSRPMAENESYMELFGKVHREFRGNRTRLQYRTRQPVNINTAPREVLVALFANLQLKVNPDDRVTPEEAGKVADKIIELRESDTPLRRMKGFVNMLRDLVQKERAITEHDRRTIYRNCLNSHDQGLRFGTAPICFRTFDTYTLRATAQVADRGGRLLAKHSATRVVEIGSQLTTSRVWETQRDFEEQLVASQDPRYWTTGPYNTGTFVREGVEPWPRWQKQVSVGRQLFFPWDPYDRQEEKTDRPFGDERDRESQLTLNGDIRLAPARMALDEAREDAIHVEHFDHNIYIEGFNAENGFAVPLTGQILGNAVFKGRLQPFVLSFWWKPRTQASGNPIAFDVGESDHRNRYTCFVDSNSNELVFAVKDNTGLERNCEIRYDLGAQGGINEEVWYHIQLVASGCDPQKMVMLVDGRAVGETTVLTHLAGGLGETDGSVAVEDASGFPARGAVCVGDEVIEYESHGDNSFLVRSDDDGNVVGRGSRGTEVNTHAEGTPVVLFGYSRSFVEGLRRGGSSLTSELGPWALVRVDTNTDADDAFPNYDPAPETREDELKSADPNDPASLGITLIMHVLPGQTGGWSGFTVTPYGLEEDESDITVEDQLGAFQDKGFCFAIYLGATQEAWNDVAEGGRDNVKPRVELMFYEKSGNAADGLSLERLSNNGGIQTAPPLDDTWEILLAFEWDGDISTETPFPAPIWIIPISVCGGQVEEGAYVNPINDEDINYWYAQLLGQTGDLDQWEWIRYAEISNTGGATYFLQSRVPNEKLLTDATGGRDWEESYLDFMLNTDVGVNDDGDPGGDPGGEPEPGEGGGNGTPAPGDPPTAPPSDGPGGQPGDAPGQDEPGDDGPGGQPGEPPPSDEPGEDGPGGQPGEPPPSDEPGEDGPGGQPGEPPPSDEPGEDGGGGNNPIPEGPADPGVGPPVPPTPDEDEGDSPEPVDPEGESDGINWLTGKVESVADVLRHRGVQSNRDDDLMVDDWWGKNQSGGNAVYQPGAMILPVAATYGGPEPADARAGKVTNGEDNTGVDFSVWPMPGIGDNVTVMTGDDTRREGGRAADVTVFWGMTALNWRLRDKDEIAPGASDTLPFEFEVFSHLWALDDFLNNEYLTSDDVDYRQPDQRDNNRICTFPSSEMPDNLANLSPSRIGVRWNGDVTPCVIDEVGGDNRRILPRLTIQDEEVSDGATSFSVVSAEGTPNEADVPEAPGIVRVGDELVVYADVGIVGNALEFSGCTRGVLRTLPSTYERGAPVEVLFGIPVAVLTGGVTESSNVLAGIGFERFPPSGVVRLENRDADQAELRLYTLNFGESVEMPINDIGGGIFTGRYGTTALGFDAGTPCFWHPVRTWDRFAPSSDDPALSFWSFSTQLSGSLIKRIFWEEGQRPENVTVRVYARIDEEAPWNATTRNTLWLSHDAQGRGREAFSERAMESLKAADRRTQEGDDPRRFLYVMEDRAGDNLINLQADKVETRVFVVYHTGAYVWNDPSKVGWKFSPIVQRFAIEYLQQSMVRRHVDR
ncbi:MAG: hypothetical protein ACYTEZ_19025 [Planctomycetota bacterium]